MVETVRFMQRGGREVVLPERPPRGADIVLLRCEQGHALGVMTRTQPHAVFAEGRRFPSYVLLDGAFQGVTEVKGRPVLLGGDLPDAQLHCGACGWADQRLAVDTAVAVAWDTHLLFCHRPPAWAPDVRLDLRTALPEPTVPAEAAPALLDLRALVSSITTTLN